MAVSSRHNSYCRYRSRHLLDLGHCLQFRLYHNKIMSSALGNKEVRLPMLPNAFQSKEISSTTDGAETSLEGGKKLRYIQITF